MHKHMLDTTLDCSRSRALEVYCSLREENLDNVKHAVSTGGVRIPVSWRNKRIAWSTVESAMYHPFTAVKGVI